MATTTNYGVPGGDPWNWSAAYGGVPNFPATLTDTTHKLGTDILAQYRAQSGLYDPTMAQLWGNVYAGAQGKLSPEVMAKIGQGMAETGVLRGQPVGTSPASSAAYARMLGLTDYDIQQKALADAKTLVGMMPIRADETTTQTTDMGAYIAAAKAMPVPGAAAAANWNSLLAGLNAGRSGVNTPYRSPWETARTPATTTAPTAGTPTAVDEGYPLAYDPYDASYDDWMTELGYDPYSGIGMVEDTTGYYAPYDYGQAPVLEDPGMFGAENFYDTSADWYPSNEAGDWYWD